MDSGCRIFAALAVFGVVLALFLGAAEAVAQEQVPKTTPTVAASDGYGAFAGSGNHEKLEQLLNTLREPKSRNLLISNIEALLESASAGQQVSGGGLSSVFGRLSNRVGGVGDELRLLGSSVEDLRLLPSWFLEQISQPERRTFWFSTLVSVAVVIVVGALSWILSVFFLKHLRSVIERRELGNIWDRLFFAVLRSTLILAPVAVFVACGFGVLAILDPEQTAKLLIVALINAIAIAFGVSGVFRSILVPLAPHLRLLPIEDYLAAYLFVWLRRFIHLTVYGWLISHLLLVIGFPISGYLALVKVIGFVILCLLVVFILQNRSAVRQWMQRNIQSGMLGTVVIERFADVWHVLAVIYVTATYLIWALGISDGFIFVAGGTIQTFLAIFIGLLVSSIVRKVIISLTSFSEELRSRYPTLETRTNRYVFVLHRSIGIIIILAVFIWILEAWKIDVLHLLRTDVGAEILARLAAISVVIVLSLLGWEMINAGIDRTLSSASSDRTGARVRTLLPLARNALLVVIVVTASITILSELGLNVAPLLAGAGVVGLAVGFGAQTLVKDIITGAFIIFDNTVAVGDVVEVAGHSGVVEAMTIRTIRLRDLSGTVHTVPFSSVETIVNMTRDYAYVVAEVGVAYREDTDQVIEVLRGVDEDLRADSAYGDRIIGPFEVLGVDRFEDSAVIIRMRIKTKPGEQWSIHREFNRRLKFAFDKHDIEIPFPHTTVYLADTGNSS